MDMEHSKKTGAVIIVDGHQNSCGVRAALLPIGETTVIRRMVSILEQSQVSPLVLVTGADREVLEKHVSGLPVILLYHEGYRDAEMIEGVQMGLKYIRPLCDGIFVMPARYPLLFPRTIHEMMECGHENVVPVYKGRRGHPVLLSSGMADHVLGYRGEGGLKGALRQEEAARQLWELAVDDGGIVDTVEGEEDCERAVRQGGRLDVYPRVQLELKRESVFFNEEAARFLTLIDYNGSMQNACRQMHISYSKGWKVIREAQRQLGFELLATKAGGAEGGSSVLTPKGRRFLDGYRLMQERLEREARVLFRDVDLW